MTRAVEPFACKNATGFAYRNGVAMMVVILSVACSISCVALAVVFLYSRDRWLSRRRENKRPISERIDAIRERTTSMIQSLEREQATIGWHPMMIEYSRRLEALAVSTSPSADDCMKLANEASQYMREHGVKELSIVSREARNLAALIRKRDHPG